MTVSERETATMIDHSQILKISLNFKFKKQIQFGSALFLYQ